MLNQGEGIVEKRHWMRLTRVCNQRCLFCLDRQAQNGTFAAFEALRRDLSRGRRMGMRRVVLSGGEPTLHPRFVEIVALARELGYGHIQAITNGRRLCYPEFLSGAVDAGLKEITFSLHGHTAALHDRLTRVPGSFIQALAALRRALAVPGLIVSVDVVVNRLNLSCLRELLEFYVGIGVREFDLLALVPFGDAWDNWEGLFCDLAQPENLSHLHRALELSHRPDLHLWTNRLRPEFLEGYESLIQPPEKILDEVRGMSRLFRRSLNGGGALSCQGSACRHCFLRDFCADLARLREEGSLPVRPRPPCLGKPRDRVGREQEAFGFGPKPDIFRFAEFYIRSRYHAKGSACRACPMGAGCEGMSVREIREKGFGIMAPG